MTPEERERMRCNLARQVYGPGSPCTDDPVIDALRVAIEQRAELEKLRAAAKPKPPPILDTEGTRAAWEEIRDMVERSLIIQMNGGVHKTGLHPVCGWSRTPIGMSDNGDRHITLEIDLNDPHGRKMP